MGRLVGSCVYLYFLIVPNISVVFFLKEKKKDGEKALTEAEIPRPSSTMDVGRSRKTKSFGDDFVNDDNQGKMQKYISKIFI